MTADASGWVEAMFRDLHKDQVWDDDPSVKSRNMGFSEVLGRRVRVGPWEDQKISTYRKIIAEIKAEEFREAASLIDYFMDEANVIYSLFRAFIPQLCELLVERGVSKNEIRDLNERTFTLLELPDGRPYMPRRLWNEVLAKGRELIFLCGGAQAEKALELIPDFKDTWRQIQDRDADHAFSLINEFTKRFGDEAIKELWEFTFLGNLFEMRYAKFDVSKFSWEDALDTNLYLAFEAMRAHLVGPDREGNIDFWEEEDRYGFRFNPCGTGGLFFQGAQVEGTPPRYEEPYNWKPIDKELDIGWNKKGVSPYCTHCNAVMQWKPIELYGYPVRVVESPHHTPEETRMYCEWFVYKDPKNTLEKYYEDVGHKKPKKFGSLKDK